MWEVTTSDSFGSRVIAIPVVDTSAIIDVERGQRVTLQAKMRPTPPLWPNTEPDRKHVAPFVDADIRRILALPAEQQIEAVSAKLKDLNPGFEGTLGLKIEGGVVSELHIVTDKVMDISPIRVFKGLRVLDCAGDARSPTGRAEPGS